VARLMPMRFTQKPSQVSSVARYSLASLISIKLSAKAAEQRPARAGTVR